jgi:hypothetical protein
VVVTGGCGGAAKAIDLPQPSAPDADLTGIVRTVDGQPVEGVRVAGPASTAP